MQQKSRVSFSSSSSVVALSVSLAVLVSACATPQSSTRPKAAMEVQPRPWNVSRVGTGNPSQSQPSSKGSLGSGSENENGPEIWVRGVKLENTQFDYPVTINSRVLQWVDYFTGRGRKHFERYLERSELFIPFIQPILREHGVPEDLVYLAMIESGFNNHARSFAKAVGPWQFISATGKRYGLMVNWWVDERRDTHKSTVAAIEYLKDLYEMFQSWELAAAAYNAGEAKVGRAIKRYGSKDFWVLSQHRYLRPETRNYVPKIMAAAIVAKNRTQFGFAPSQIPVHSDELIAGDGEVVQVKKEKTPTRGELQTLAETSDDESPSVNTADKERLLAILKKDTEWNEYEDYPEVLLENDSATTNEKDSGLRAKGSAQAQKQPATQARPIIVPMVSKQGELQQSEQLAEFEVQSPADLLEIARAAELSYQTVKALNPEVLRWCTPPRMASFRIKLPVSVKEKFLTNYNSEGFQKRVDFLSYRAKKGDSLARIARHFGIRVDPLVDLNSVSPKATLRAGMKVELPLPQDGDRSFASLEVRDPPEKRKARRGKRYSSKKYYNVSYKKRAAARKRAAGGT
jgi:hypothetical protein